jgi:hypothetical protein
VTTPPFDSKAIAEAVYWARFLSEEWLRDFADAPTRIHTNAVADDGTPQWQRAFTQWIDGGGTPDDIARQRTTKVMRKLRRTAPREYEVLYRAMVAGESFEQITAWLNERALRNGIERPGGRAEGYRLKDSVALFVAGVDFARCYW